jgi:hypothetical protein
MTWAPAKEALTGHGWKQAPRGLGMKIRKLVNAFEVGEDPFGNGMPKTDWCICLDVGWQGEFSHEISKQARKVKSLAKGRQVWWIDQGEWTQVNLFFGTEKELTEKVNGLLLQAA